MSIATGISDKSNLKKVNFNPFSGSSILKVSPTTQSQQEMWSSLEMNESATLCYNECIVVSISGNVNIKVFEQAFQELLKNHDVFRSVFSPDGKYFFVQNYESQSVDFLDFSQRSDAQTEVEQLCQQEVSTKFDLINGPCYRAKLIKVGNSQFSFVLTAHHIICDGWSFAILLSELSSCYQQLVSGKFSSDESCHQFFDYAVQEFQQGENGEHKRYWLNVFQDPLVVNPFPTDYTRPKFRTFDSARMDIALPEKLVKDLKLLGSKHGCSFYSTLMSVFNLLLYKLTNSSDVVVGMAAATQPTIGQTDLVGHLVNLLPLRSQLSEGMSFEELLKITRTKMLDAFDHNQIGFGSLVRALPHIKRDPAEIPLLNVVFNIDQQSPGQGLDFGDLKASYVTYPRTQENFELFVNAVSLGNSLCLEVQYNTNLFKPETIKNWVSCFISLAEFVVQESKIKISAIKLPDLIIPKALKAEQSIPLTITRNLEIEAKIKSIWAKVLLNEDLSVEDNFFSIGGHSLLAIEVANLVKQEFSVNFSMKDVFEAPTIQSMAEKLFLQNKSKDEDLTGLMKINDNLNVAKVSYNQMQTWYLEEMHPRTRMHNLPNTFRVPFKIDAKILEQVMHFIFRRHAALRTAIVVENGVPVQKVLSPDLPCFKPSIKPIKTTLSKAMDYFEQEVNHVFDKTNPPLCRVSLYDFENHESAIFFMAHHSVWDGWSFDIFLDELDILYTAIKRGQKPIFPREPVVSYIDYTLWLDSLLKTGKLEKESEYWQKKLAAPLPVLELPLDFKRPKVLSHKGELIRFLLSDDQAKKVREYAQQQGTSLFTVFLTAFKVSLARASGVNDVIVGSPIRGRNHPDVLQTIGFFVSTVALRTSIDLKLSFEDNLRMVTQTAAEAFDNQMTPFQIILNKIKYVKDPSRSPIFQTLFSYQDVNNRAEQIDGIPFTRFPVDKSSTHTDLDLWMKTNDHKIEGGFEFNPDLFTVQSMQRFIECFFFLLDNLQNHVTKPLQEIPVLPLNQQKLIENEWNNTKVKPERFVTLNQSFEEMAERYPNNIAVECQGKALSYAELDRLSNRLAHGLTELGAKPGELVGISLPRNENLLVALLGVLKTGAGYVPLDPSFPQDRLDYMLENSCPKILLTDSELSKRFNNKYVKALLNDVLNSSVDETALKVEQTPADTIYVIYTSGSTGHPKGVQLTHGSVTNFLLSMQKEPGLTAQDRLLAVTTLCFDIAVLELFLPLFTGASVVLASSQDVIDGMALKTILETKNITMMQATPSTWRLLLSAGWKGSPHLKVLCGGEAFPSDLAQKLIPITEEVWNMYGPTETTVWSSCKRLSKTDKLITIGKAIDNTALYVLDENLNHMPIGSVGELYIGGQGLAQGYFKRPDLTAERFISNPFRPGEKMYATGDLARFTSQGEVECLGRRDGQVKVRGYRIELGEIEAELQKLPEVREAAVNVCEYRPGDFRIIAYIVTKDGALNQRLIREALAKRLPSYMVPSNFVELTEIPKTLNGKVDKKNLPALKDESLTVNELPAEKKVVSDEPTISSVETLKVLWQEILGVKEIKSSDNFFDLGGNSLLAVELFAKIAEKFKLNLPLSFLLEADDFQGFANAVEVKLSGESSTNVASGTLAIPQVFKALVAIKNQGTQNALFCFHGVGGNILNYVPLAAATTNKRPLLALQALGLDGREQLPASIEEMASEYIKEMKLVQPEGPYLLAGGSMGGMIALEVATQLTRSGDQIEKLIMFDTFGPNVNLKNYSKDRAISKLKALQFSLSYKFKILKNSLRSRLHRALGLPVPLSTLLFNIEWNNYKALWKYRPQTYSGNIDLIRSQSKEEGWYSDPKMGWEGTILGDIKTYEINGTHETFMESPELVQVLKTLV